MLQIVKKRQKLEGNRPARRRNIDRIQLRHGLISLRDTEFSTTGT